MPAISVETVPIAIGVIVAALVWVAAVGGVFPATWSSLHAGTINRVWADLQLALISAG